VSGNCGKLHNEINYFTVVWQMRWVGQVACMWEEKNTYRVKNVK